MRHRSILHASLEHIKRSLPLILLLRKPDLSFSFSHSVKLAEADCFSDKNIDGIKSDSKADPQEQTMVNSGGKNGLLLYYNQFSFYSQKVVMALYEKNLPFETMNIELTGEQYKSWFLQLNPKGEVPVLQDTGKIIPDSARIIDYLEDNFSNGDTPRLIPIDQSPEIKQKVTYFRELIDKINGNVLTIGSMLHPELATGSKKVPFIAPVRKQLLNADKNSADNLRKYAIETPEAANMLLEKAKNQEKKREKLLNKEEFLTICSQAEEVLDKVEAELEQHTGDKQNWWLCSDRFTVSDISLAILLLRIDQIGMEPFFWTNQKRPQIEKYFSRVQERDSFKKTVPTTFSLIKTIFTTQVPLIIGVSIAAAIVIIIGGWFVVKKLIHK